MHVFACPAYDAHEQVVFFQDRDSGLEAIVAIHDTTLGPAVGGCRMWPYESEAAALTDVLRLARGMTYKAAMAGLPFGGGKAVVIGDPRTAKTDTLFRALGRAVDTLGGRYYTGEDVGTTPADMDCAGGETRFILGRSRGSSGDPAPVTARGVWLGIRAAVRHRLGREDLRGLRIAVQGLGHVGYHLARLLHQDGAVLLVADLDAARSERAAGEFGARVLDPGEILRADAEVLAPCALGGVLDDASVPRLRCAIVAGAANNQLQDARHGAALHARGILYAPDYVINAGGLINATQELRPGGYDRQRALMRLGSVPATLAEIFERAEAEGVPSAAVADQLAVERLNLARRVRAPRWAEPAGASALARAAAG